MDAFESDLVVSNADYATTYMKMIEPKYRVESRLESKGDAIFHEPCRDCSGSKSVRARVFSTTTSFWGLYEALLSDIFDRKILADDFSQYLHIPTLTDPSLAPEIITRATR